MFYVIYKCFIYICFIYICFIYVIYINFTYVIYMFYLCYLYSNSLPKTSGVYCTNLDGDITVKDISNGKTIYNLVDRYEISISQMTMDLVLFV